jgi:hypothetical protein
MPKESWRNRRGARFPVYVVRSLAASAIIATGARPGTGLHDSDRCDLVSHSRAPRTITWWLLEWVQAIRRAAATTAAYRAGNQPHLANALLQNTDPRVTQEHYNRASSMTAALDFARLARDRS